MVKVRGVIRISDDGAETKYKSVTDAADDTAGCERTLIARAIRKGWSHVGYRWQYENDGIKKMPNVLFLDIETAPMLVYSWGLYKQNLSCDNIEEDWFIICWAAKWMHRSEIIADCVTPKEAVNQDDKRVCKNLFEYLEKADIIIAHNGRKFDVRKINSRFLVHGLKRPSPYQIIDTLVESRKCFAHSSHRLNYLGKLLVRKEKIDTDFELWKRCKRGEVEALKYMDTYCQNDILLLEDVYIEMRGWIKSHPNLGLYGETSEPVCPTCMSTEIELCGEYVTMAGRFNAFRCAECGGIGRLRLSNVTPKEKEGMVLSVAR